ncbi:MAG TPA: nuclear transport factor 2 family protein [Nocardioides sp.]|nr:nuclear transport factor 2 family protein [Nocardioides sp.]
MDRTAVLETLYRLQSAIDARDWALVSATFLPDARGYGASGVEAIVARMRAHLDGCGPTQHLIGNSVVTFDGPAAATVRSAARVFHVGAGEKEGSSFECMGDYTDRFELVDGSWRLAHRRFEMRVMLGDFGVLKPS